MSELTAEIIEHDDILEVKLVTDDGIVISYELPIEIKMISDDEILGICIPRAIQELSGVQTDRIYEQE